MKNVEEDSHLLNFTERLCILRKLRGLTVRELAAKAGVSASLISNIENGRSNPSISTIAGICAALEVEVADLFSPVSLELQAQKREEREVLAAADGIRKTVLLREGDRGVSLYEVEMPAGATTGTLSNEPGAVDLVVVVRGRVIVQLSGVRVVLETGDSLRFGSDLAYSIVNDSADAAVFQWLAFDTKGR